MGECNLLEVWGGCRRLVSCIFRGAFGTSVWKKIRKEWDIVFPPCCFLFRKW